MNRHSIICDVCKVKHTSEPMESPEAAKRNAIVVAHSRGWTLEPRFHGCPDHPALFRRGTLRITGGAK